MKKHNLLKVTLLVLLLVVIGTWFLPVYTVSSASEGFTIQESIKVGLFNLASYVGIVLQVFGPVLLYVLSIGALYGVLYQIPQYRMLLDKIADGFKGKEWLFMTIVGVVFALLSSMAGLSVVLMLLFPFVISVILLMGYDRTTAALLVVGSVIAGLIGSVFDVNGVYGISAVFSQIGFEDAWNLAKLDVIWKIVLLVVSFFVLISDPETVVLSEFAPLRPVALSVVWLELLPVLLSETVLSSFVVVLSALVRYVLLSRLLTVP